jgi:hypothetical protein
LRQHIGETNDMIIACLVAAAGLVGFGFVCGMASASFLADDPDELPGNDQRFSDQNEV